MLVPPGIPRPQLTVQEWYAQREAEYIARDVIGMIPVRKTPRKRQEMTKPKLSRAQVVQAQLKALQEEMAHLARFPEDTFVDNTVLQVVKTYKRPLLTGQVEEQQYTYVLLKANGQWWCTGQNGHQINGASWDKVIEFVDGDELIDVRTGLSVMTDATQKSVVTTSDPSLKASLNQDYIAQVKPAREES